MFIGKFKAYPWNALGGVTEYKAVVRCDSTIYNQLATDKTQIVTLLEEKVGGYDEFTDMMEAVFDTINFAPTDAGKFFVSLNASNVSVYPYFNAVMHEFGAYEIEGDPVDDYGLYEITSDLGGGTLIGRVRMDGLPRATNSFNEASFITDAAIEIEHPTRQFNFTYNMSIFPDNFIKYGKWDFSALDYSDNENKVGYKASLTIYIWLEEDGKTWNATILMNGVASNIEYLQDRYNGNDIEVYNTSDPNNTKQDPKDPGGNGDGDLDPDKIPMPNLPSSDMTASGSIRIYRMTSGDVATLVNYLHSNAPGDAIIKWFGNPIQGIVSLHYLPYPVRLKAGAQAEEIKIVGVGTGVAAIPAEQFQTIDFGYVYVGTNRNNYLDYAPYTKMQIYLPGIGIRDINTDDVMGKYIRVKYNCDNCTGQFVAFVLVGTTSNELNMTVKYTFSGSVAAPFPLSQSNWGNTYIAAATLAAGALAGGVAAAGAAGAAASGGGAAAATGAATEAASGAAGGISAGAMAQGATNIGSAVTSLSKPSISRAGTVSGTTSLFGVREPYLIIERPNQQDFADFEKIKGYPCGRTYQLGKLSGYTQVESVHLTGIGGTVGEINEIENLLKSGVIL